MGDAIRPDGGGALPLAAATVVAIGPRLDRSSLPEVRDELAQAIEQSSGDIVVDLGSVEWLDVAGLAALVAAHRRLQHQGRRLILRGARPRVRRALAVTRLNRVLILEPSLGEV